MNFKTELSLDPSRPCQYYSYPPVKIFSNVQSFAVSINVKAEFLFSYFMRK